MLIGGCISVIDRTLDSCCFHTVGYKCIAVQKCFYFSISAWFTADFHVIRCNNLS